MLFVREGLELLVMICLICFVFVSGLELGGNVLLCFVWFQVWFEVCFC